MTDFNAILETLRHQMEAAVADDRRETVQQQMDLFRSLLRGLTAIAVKDLKLDHAAIAVASMTNALTIVATNCDINPSHRAACKAMTHHMVDKFLAKADAPDPATGYHQLRGEVVSLVMAVRGSPLPANHQVRVEAERVLQTL